jgi:hypothetical protein
MAIQVLLASAVRSSGSRLSKIIFLLAFDRRGCNRIFIGGILLAGMGFVETAF